MGQPNRPGLCSAIRWMFAGALALSPFWITGCGSDGSGPEDAGVKDGGDADAGGDGGATETCDADPKWVTNPSRPTTFSDSTNCAFHQWSYQTFLYLLNGGSKEAPLDSLGDPKDLFTDNPGPYPGRSPAGGPPPLRTVSRITKSKRIGIDPREIYQAGPEHATLLDQKGQVVFYSLHVDESYWKSVLGHQLNDLTALQKIGPDSKIEFDVGSLELKAAWRIAEDLGEGAEPGAAAYIPDAEKRFVTRIATVTPPSLDRSASPPKPRRVKLALVGLHVTGVVTGHDEFVWATFEHVDNAPDCDRLNTPPPAAGWSFHDGKATKDQCNKAPLDPKIPPNVCRIAPTATESMVTKPCDPNDKSEHQAQNDRNIARLNRQVRAQLQAAGSVLANYELVGAIWTTGAIPVNAGSFSNVTKDGPFQKGSCGLANTAMETFTQDQNCFACHNAGEHFVSIYDQNDKETSVQNIGPKDVNLSHFVVNYQASAQAKKGATAPSQKK